TSTVECQWSPSLTFKVGSHWPPGAYLLKLVGDDGEQQYVPLCVRDDSSTAAFVLQHSVTTWQAYNLWGGYDLYYGLTGGGSSYSMSTAGMNYASRARIVSFDRPFPKAWAQGASDFIGNEFPLVYHMEQLGLDVTYWTDVDFHAHPERLLQHRCMFSLGHDEYWSLQMRDGALAARDAGVNFGFLGANACYRQIRLEASPVGNNRRQVCYKSATEDPLYGQDDEVVTAPSWDSPPTSWPESQLIGSMYQDVGADADLVVYDSSSWLWAGTGVTDGQSLPKVVQGEYDRFDPSFAGPSNVEIAAHSPVVNRGAGRYSDVTWYSVPGGGGVFATGNASWVNKLSHTTGFPTTVVPSAIPGVTPVLLRVMENVYSALGTGPGSITRPSRANWQKSSSLGTTPPPSVAA
ncbi:MAG: N,N-dimethylformamidase beta subunit family domain-containing protein, partial [Nitrososphaerales archaeon]